MNSHLPQQQIALLSSLMERAQVTSYFIIHAMIEGRFFWTPFEHVVFLVTCVPAKFYL